MAEFRWLNGKELRARRRKAAREKTVLGAFTAPPAPSSGTPPPILVPKPMTPLEAWEHGRSIILGDILQDRKKFAQLRQIMRTQYPNLTRGMSDEDIARLARESFDEKLKESNARVFGKMGRGRELQIKTGGY